MKIGPMAKLGEEYTDKLSAEGIIRYIVNDYVELSYEKVTNQRDWYKRICKRWLDWNK